MLNPSLDYVGTKTRVKFNGDCLKQEKITFNHGEIVNICIVCEIERSVNISIYPVVHRNVFCKNEGCWKIPLKTFTFNTVPDFAKWAYIVHIPPLPPGDGGGGWAIFQNDNIGGT